MARRTKKYWLRFCANGYAAGMNWQPLFAQRTAQMRRSTVRELLKVTAQPGMISFGGGIPAPELFPIEEVARATAAVLARFGEQALQYGETEGIAGLRDWVAARFSRPHCQIRRENVTIVTGSQQGLDLIGKVFLDAGDRVLVENPTYLAMLSAWRPQQPAFVPLCSDGDGACVDELPALAGPRAKLVYLVPNFQNPQGATLTLVRRRRLLDELRGSGTILVEDDPYGELRYAGEPLPSLLELDAANGAGGALETRVIQLGTFSKVLAPGLRVGWVIAPAAVIDKLVQAKQAADLHTSTLCQHVVLELLQNGVLERQLPRLRAEYGRRRATMLAALATHFPNEAHWTRPDGGLFLFVTLPPHIDASALLKRALAHNVAFVPGDDFHLDGQGRNTMRLNFSNATPEKIEEGIKRLGRVLAERPRFRSLQRHARPDRPLACC
ncbi:MAG TPA: PLP-dependent aminotransferase family protein [Verrucomicrobiae bacterium]